MNGCCDCSEQKTPVLPCAVREECWLRRPAATHTGSGLLSRDMMALLPCLATMLLMASARILSFICCMHRLGDTVTKQSMVEQLEQQAALSWSHS